MALDGTKAAEGVSSVTRSLGGGGLPAGADPWWVERRFCGSVYQAEGTDEEGLPRLLGRPRRTH